MEQHSAHSSIPRFIDAQDGSENIVQIYHYELIIHKKVLKLRKHIYLSIIVDQFESFYLYILINLYTLCLE